MGHILDLRIWRRASWVINILLKLAELSWGNTIQHCWGLGFWYVLQCWGDGRKRKRISKTLRCDHALYRWESPTLCNATSYLITWWLRTVTISVGRGWWVYPSDTLLWPPIFDFLLFSLHRRSSDTYHADATFCDIHANLCTITIDYTLYP